MTMSSRLGGVGNAVVDGKGATVFGVGAGCSVVVSVLSLVISVVISVDWLGSSLLAVVTSGLAVIEVDVVSSGLLVVESSAVVSVVTIVVIVVVVTVEASVLPP